MCHGAEAAIAARQAAEEAFEGGISDNLLTIALGNSEIPLYKAIVDSGFATSNSEARKLIAGKGVKLDTILIEDEQYNLRLSDKPIKLSIGKKKHILLKV
jgi:tyrosyl-tRNA synthetase